MSRRIETIWGLFVLTLFLSGCTGSSGGGEGGGEIFGQKFSWKLWWDCRNQPDDPDDPDNGPSNGGKAEGILIDEAPTPYCGPVLVYPGEPSSEGMVVTDLDVFITVQAMDEDLSWVYGDKGIELPVAYVDIDGECIRHNTDGSVSFISNDPRDILATHLEVQFAVPGEQPLLITFSGRTDAVMGELFSRGIHALETDRVSVRYDADKGTLSGFYSITDTDGVVGREPFTLPPLLVSTFIPIPAQKTAAATLSR